MNVELTPDEVCWISEQLCEAINACDFEAMGDEYVATCRRLAAKLNEVP